MKVGVLNGYGDTTWDEQDFKLGTEYSYPSCISTQKYYPVEHHYMQGYQITNSPEFSNLTTAYNQAGLTIQMPHIYQEAFVNLICNGTEINAITILRNYFVNNHNYFNEGYLASIKLLENDPNPFPGGKTLIQSDLGHNQSPSFVYSGKARENPTNGEKIMIATTIHELAHQIAVLGHSDHNSSCCVVSSPWPPGTCSYSSNTFCNFHKCLLHNFILDW